jgi:hypothetical protein
MAANQDQEIFDFKTNIPEINKGIKDLISSLGKLNGSLSSSTRAQEGFRQSNDRLENSLEDTDDKINKVSDSGEKQSKVLDTLKSKFTSLSNNYKSAFAAISPLNLGTIGLSFSMSSLVSTAFAEVKALSSLGDSMTYLSSDTGSVTSGLFLWKFYR